MRSGDDKQLEVTNNSFGDNPNHDRRCSLDPPVSPALQGRDDSLPSRALAPLASHVKYTAEECRRVTDQARALYPILGDPSAVAERVRIFQALGNETRLQILGLLSVRETCVCNIVKTLGGAASTIAHHLRMLEDAGLVTAKQDGKFTIYALNEAILIKHRVFEVNV